MIARSHFIAFCYRPSVLSFRPGKMALRYANDSHTRVIARIPRHSSHMHLSPFPASSCSENRSDQDLPQASQVRQMSRPIKLCPNDTLHQYCSKGLHIQRGIRSPRNIVRAIEMTFGFDPCARSEIASACRQRA
jgi:hypothetical protein